MRLSGLFVKDVKEGELQVLVVKAAGVTGMRVTKSQALGTGERKQLFFVSCSLARTLVFFFLKENTYMRELCWK